MSKGSTSTRHPATLASVGKRWPGAVWTSEEHDTLFVV